MHRTSITGAALLSTGFLLASLPMGSPASARETHGQEAQIYSVVAEGMTPDAAKELAASANIGLALRADGAFSYVDNARYLDVPTKAVSKKKRTGRDEERQATVAEAVDLKKLKRTKVISRAEALKRAEGLLPEVEGFDSKPTVAYTTVDVSSRKGKLKSRTKLDTTVTYNFQLDGIPVVGAGAKQRISFDGKGRVLQLSRSVRSIKADGSVAIISPGEALEQCQRLYGEDVKQSEPTLVYYSPPLNADRASGKGGVQHLLPQYSCQPKQRADKVGLTGKLIPAAPQLTPTVYLNANRDGDFVHASMDISGGTGPFDIQWSSSTTALKADGLGVEYQRTARGKTEGETLSVTVTDANGQVSTASVQLDQSGRASTKGFGGAGGALAEVGIEQTIDEWQCAQDSANGFKSVMQSKGHTVNFDWRGASAFEKDFKESSFGGWDSLSAPNRYVDEVDAQWYTGHGWPGGFTFKGNHDDTTIVPGDARWGDHDLEWMQLESCQVLKDTNGKADYFARWDEVFNGLHLLNGFDTNAYCIGGGTGARFASYLFPQKFLWWTIRPAYTVQQAWATMANDLEPAGVRWRSVSPMKGSISNLGDHFWGQGTVGPDITPSQRTGFIAISGVS